MRQAKREKVKDKKVESAYLKVLLFLQFTFYLFTFAFAPRALANTIDAASCAANDVQSAINSASTGDTVVVPSGSCTWTSQVSIASKGLTLQGQTVCAGTPAFSCTDNTKITLSASGEPALSVTGVSGTNFVIITGFSWTITGVEVDQNAISVDGTFQSVGFRFHHNHQVINTGGVSSTKGISVADIYGLIDHNVFDILDTVGTYHSAEVFGDWTTDGFRSWQQPLAVGTDQAVYIEDNTFNNSNQNEECLDGYAGGRAVVRHNQFNNTFTSFHGTDSGFFRSFFSLEMYQNTFTNNSSVTFFTPLYDHRGGTALIWGNTLNGSTPWGGVAEIADHRTMQGQAGTSTWGLADGTTWYLGSLTPTNGTLGTTNSTDSPDWQASYSYANLTPILPTSNNSGSYNYTAQGACTSGSTRPSFNQTIGGSTTDGTCTWYNEGGGAAGIGARWCAINRDTPATSDATCAAITPGDTASTFFDGSGPSGYPTRDQPGRTHNQALAPIYEWLNTTGGIELNTTVPGQNSTYLAANRDYYSYTASFNGTSGVGSGTSAQIPTTCTSLVAYWATDTNTLYQCSTPNTWTAYYTPYTYPHPLQGAGNTPPPPPSGGGNTASSFNPRAYPNPWRADRGYAQQINFDQLAGNTTIKIFTISGHLVRTLTTGNSSTTWDLNNDSGDRVASGIYIYLVTNDQGQEARGKVAVIR
jgi:hypothetical protein